MTGYIGIGGTAKKVKNIYVGVGGVAKKVKKGYIGVGGVAKLWYTSQREWIWDVYTVNSGYREVEGSSTTVTRSSAFYAGTTYTFNQNTGEFSVAQTTQISRNSTGATNAVGKYYVTLTNSSGTQTGTTLYLITAATYSTLRLNLTVTPYTSEAYTERGTLVGSVTDLDVTAYPMNGIQNGYWYVLRNSVAQIVASYSGAYTDELVDMGDGPYRLLTLTGSGTLALEDEVEADVWICGGGANGGTGGTGSTTAHSGKGGGGGYAAESDKAAIQNLTVVVGAAGGDTSVSGDISLNAYAGNTSGNGGTGGGRNRGVQAVSNYTVGTGDGLPKLPFGDSYFPYPFCDGGGGGGYDDDGSRYNGGDGGTNGSNGLATSSIAGTSSTYGAGGGHYGGRGGCGYRELAALSATGYGSGGGGGGGECWWDDDNNKYKYYRYSEGNGYQGVCFIRIPL